MPNESSSLPVTAFAVPVDEVERLTGLDFFSRLPDEIEDELESQVDIKLWDCSSKPVIIRVSSPEAQPDSQEALFQDKTGGQCWLNTRSKIRHNSGCKYFRGTGRGRFCDPDEGKACGICGG